MSELGKTNGYLLWKKRFLKEHGEEIRNKYGDDALRAGFQERWYNLPVEEKLELKREAAEINRAVELHFKQEEERLEREARELKQAAETSLKDESDARKINQIIKDYLDMGDMDDTEDAEGAEDGE